MNDSTIPNKKNSLLEYFKKTVLENFNNNRDLCPLCGNMDKFSENKSVAHRVYIPEGRMYVNVYECGSCKNQFTTMKKYNRREHSSTLELQFNLEVRIIE